MSLKLPRSRIGARGAQKVKTGCLTCKIRHKKCDETRPACLRCSSTGRQCDFLFPARRPRISAVEGEAQNDPLSAVSTAAVSFRLPMSSSSSASDFEHVQFEFYRLVCAPEYGVLFETPSWESLVLRFSISEPCIYHAALAIGSLMWNQYSPRSQWHDPATRTVSATAYSTIHYNRAIRYLNTKLSSEPAPDKALTQLTILSAILFIQIEFLQGQVITSQTSYFTAHLHGATSLMLGLRNQLGEQIDSDSECLEIGVLCLGLQAQQISQIMVQNAERQQTI
ncbi:hypothetical protein F4808DRAFT_411020 [Astrocystis sublimbata]|nr:hypothetical protein F4808DRAFT_411020 [Astrocystis sublimbata]